MKGRKNYFWSESIYFKRLCTKHTFGNRFQEYGYISGLYLGKSHDLGYLRGRSPPPPPPQKKKKKKKILLSLQYIRNYIGELLSKRDEVSVTVTRDFSPKR